VTVTGAAGSSATVGERLTASARELRVATRTKAKKKTSATHFIVAPKILFRVRLPFLEGWEKNKPLCNWTFLLSLSIETPLIFWGFLAHKETVKFRPMSLV
jgi:hypothetical protein